MRELGAYLATEFCTGKEVGAASTDLKGLADSLVAGNCDGGNHVCMRLNGWHRIGVKRLRPSMWLWGRSRLVRLTRPLAATLRQPLGDVLRAS